MGRRLDRPEGRSFFGSAINTDMRMYEIISENKEALEKIEEATDQEIQQYFGENSDIVYAYDEENRYGHGRELQQIGPPGSLGTWHDVMKAALAWNAGEYGDFQVDNVAKILNEFDDSASFGFYAAREYSVAMYINSYRGRSREQKVEALQAFRQFVLQNQDALKADEVNIYPEGRDFANVPVLRLWWD